MQNYLTQVSAAAGQPGFDWIPALNAASDAHKGAYGIPWTSGRSNWTAATNDVIGRANPSWLDWSRISDENIGANTSGIRAYQDSFDTSKNWVPIVQGLLTVLSAGLLAPVAAGAGAAVEAGGAAAAGAGAAGAAGGAGLAELGLIATPALADAAIAAGIPAGMLAGGGAAVGGAASTNLLTQLLAEAGIDVSGLSGNFLSEFGVPDLVTSAGKNFATGMLTGKDPKEALLGALLPPGIQMAGEYLPSFEDFSSWAGGTPSVDVVDPTLPDAGNPLKRQLSFSSADAPVVQDMGMFSPTSYVNQPGFLGAESLDEALAGTTSPAMTDLAEGVTYAPGTYTGFDPVTGAATFDPSLAPPTEPAAPTEPRISDAEAKKYASMAQKVYDLLGGEDAVSQGAPRRRGSTGPDGEEIPPTPEEEAKYFGEVTDYLGLDTAAIAEAGFVPGSPEYLDYIMQQIDAIIAQVIGDANPDNEDFGALLRGKTEKELQNLSRALYIRGQLGASVGPGSYLDPFTGIMEDVAAPEGSRFQPSTAAYQRGIARFGEDLAGKRGQEAKRHIGGMLDREPDLFRMQARRDARALQEALGQTPMEDPRRRRRGMFSDATQARTGLERMGGQDIDRMLALIMGRDPERQGDAIEELFGWAPEQI